MGIGGRATGLTVDAGTWRTHGGRTPFRFEHDLVDEPRLTHAALVDLCGRVPAELVEMNRADLPTVFATDEVPALDRRPREIAEQLVGLQRWVSINNVECDADMRQLIDVCLDPVADTIGDFEGGMTSREGYVFMSPPGARVPVHLDFEHNLFLQIRGTKRITVGFVEPELEQRTLESMTGGAYGRLPALPPETVEFLLEPGDGMYISPRLAHTVDTLGDDLSISFSLVFQTPWLERGARVLAANHDLRRLGLKPGPYGSSPIADRTKSSAVTVWRGLKTIGRR